MSEILHANIFFFIASAATVLFVLLVCVAMYQVIRILRSIRSIVERVEQGSEVLAEDIEHVRTYVLEGSLISQVIKFFVGKRPGARRRTRSPMTSDNSDDNEA